MSLCCLFCCVTGNIAVDMLDEMLKLIGNPSESVRASIASSIAHLCNKVSKLRVKCIQLLISEYKDKHDYYEEPQSQSVQIQQGISSGNVSAAAISARKTNMQAIFHSRWTFRHINY